MSADARQATSELLIGRRLGGYTITRCVGKGGMGLVYEALHESGAERAAVKVLSDSLFKDDKVLQRFFNEAKALSIVQHESIVKVFEFGQLDDGTPFIMMEFLAGEPLLDYMQRGPGPGPGPGLALPVVLELGRQLAAALAASHEKGVIHRDLKPENIFIIPDAAAPLGERVKLLDFGIAKFLDGPTRKTTIGTILGTPLYMSPEQCEGSQDLDAKVDVYALGVLLYEMLSGQLPFMAETTAAIMRQHIFKAPPLLTARAPWVPVETAELVHCMLAKPAAERPAMSAVLAALEALLSQTAVMQSGPRRALALQLAAHRQPGVVIGGAVVDPMASTLGGQPDQGPAAGPADAVTVGPWSGAAGDRASAGPPPVGAAPGERGEGAQGAQRSGVPQPMSSAPAAAVGAGPRRLLVGAALVLMLMLALIVLWLRPGASRRASGSQQAASTTVATAPSAPPAPGAAAAPAAPAPAAGSDPGVGPAAAAAAGHERRSEEKAAPKSVKPRPGGKRPRGAAAGRDPALSPEEDPDQAWR